MRERIEVPVVLGIHDAWWVHVGTTLAWLMDHPRVPRDETRTEAVYLACSRRFTTWVEPVAEERRTFAEEAAWFLLEQELDAAD